MGVDVRKLALALLLAICPAAFAKVVTMQVTIGAGTTQILTSGHIYCKWLAFQNNATHNMRIGDVNTSSTRGIVLLPTGSLYTGPYSTTNTDLFGWYVQGTTGDVVDIIYEDGQQ